MGKYDYSQTLNPQEIDTDFVLYTQYAQTYADYNGCLPQDDDAADHIKRTIRAIRIG